MDLLSLNLRLAEGRAEVHLHDAGGTRTHELTGDSFGRLLQAAGPLLAQLAGDGPAAQLSIDPPAESLRLVSAGGAEHLRTGEAYRALHALLRPLARVATREARPRAPDLPAASDAELWERKYLLGSDGWELMRPAPPLLRLLREDPPPPGSLALVPGCGRGHEARLLATTGARVTAVDIAPTAVAETRRLAAAEGLSEQIEVSQEDLFLLPAARPGRYDLVLEHCCFCAIDPARRDEYVDAVHALLRPGGRLIGLFWCHDYEGGPPYGATPQEIRDRFGRRFHILHEEVPPDSVLVRAGQEFLTVMERS